jgi:hypothetical protein
MDSLLALPKYVFSITFFCIQVVNFGFFVGSMNFNIWFHQNWGWGSNSYQFRGQLLGPLSNLNNQCGNDDTYSDCYENCDNYCDRWNNWYGAGAAFVFFDTMASILAVVIAVITVLDYFKFKYCRRCINLLTTGILMIIIFVLHLLGFIIWAGAVQLRFDKCTHDANYDGVETVCGEGGAIFALWNFFWLLFVVPFYFYICYKLWKKEKDEGQQSSPPLVEN